MRRGGQARLRKGQLVGLLLVVLGAVVPFAAAAGGSGAHSSQAGRSVRPQQNRIVMTLVGAPKVEGNRENWSIGRYSAIWKSPWGEASYPYALPSTLPLGA
jgi:hypothetical protein